MTIEHALEWGKEELYKSGVPESELSAWYLLQSCFRRAGGTGQTFSRSDYFLKKKEEILPDQKKRYELLVEKRKQRMPLEYIIGYTEFMGLTFSVDENVLIPRQDTETLVEAVYPLCKGKRVLDLCTGSGCIGLSIGVLGAPASLVLSDISAAALRVAEQNGRQLAAEESGLRSVQMEFVCGDLFENIKGVFDIIVSNPPYIESGGISGLMPEVGMYEPITALDGGGDGLDFYRRIIGSSPSYLCGGGMLYVETGYNQGESVAALMREHGFEQIKIRKDLAGNDRVVSGRTVAERKD